VDNRKNLPYWYLNVWQKAKLERNDEMGVEAFLMPDSFKKKGTGTAPFF
jgi:hypothetical protein